MRITNYKGDVVEVDIDEDLVFAGQEKSIVYPDGSTHTRMEFVELVDDGSGNIRLWDNKDGQVPQGWYMSLRPMGGWMKADWPDWLSRKDGQGRARPRRFLRLAFIDESVLKTKPGDKWAVHDKANQLETWTVMRLSRGVYFIRSRVNELKRPLRTAAVIFLILSALFLLIAPFIAREVPLTRFIPGGIGYSFLLAFGTVGVLLQSSRGYRLALILLGAVLCVFLAVIGAVFLLARFSPDAVLRTGFWSLQTLLRFGEFVAAAGLVVLLGMSVAGWRKHIRSRRFPSP